MRNTQLKLMILQLDKKECKHEMDRGDTAKIDRRQSEALVIQAK